MTPFHQAREAWEAASDLRTTRSVLKQYAYGRQWDALRRSVAHGLAAPSKFEEAHLRNSRPPITNNLIRSLIKTVVGRFRLNLSEERRDEAALPAELRIRRANRLDELDARALEEFLISGCAIQRVTLERRFDGTEVWVDNVNPSRFFCNRFMDPRGSDIRLIGMLHEMSLPEMCLRFGHGSRRRHRDLGAIFSRGRGGVHAGGVARLASEAGETDFSTPSDPSLCRIVEVWTLEIDKRKGPVWVCRYYSPDGELIDTTPSPFAHRSHPFVVTLYPLTDGEVHPFIEDVIDRQRHINMLISNMDQILAHSAKGVLLFPTDALPEGTDMRLATDLWGNPGGVIPINPNASRLPAEVAPSGHTQAPAQLLELDLRLFQQISGVSGALLGQASSGYTTSSLYQAQADNAVIALRDIFDTFASFREARTAKALSISKT